MSPSLRNPSNQKPEDAKKNKDNDSNL